MGLDNIVDSDSSNDTETDQTPSKTQLVFWNLPQQKGYGADAAPDIEQAYRLVNGSGKLRNTFDGATIDEDHSWEDIHHFVAELLVGVNSAIFESDASPIMDTVMLDGDDIIQYMDENPEVKQSVVQSLNEQAQAAREGDEEPAEADD